MNTSIRMLLVALLAATAAMPVCAQLPVPAESPAKGATNLAPRCCIAAAGTVIDLEITESVSSNQHKKGDRFGLRLHAPLILDGVTILPAGVVGVGEVVHAARTGIGGKPGELLLAARFLKHDSRQIPLRGFKLGASGKDRTNAAMTATVALAMTIPVLSPVTLLVRGNEVVIPAGTRAIAKLATDVQLMLATNPISPASDQHVPPTQE